MAMHIGEYREGGPLRSASCQSTSGFSHVVGKMNKELASVHMTNK
jgi:hypothetical protein